jgi:hypothetical protein
MPIDACHLVRELSQHACALRQLARSRVKVRKNDRRGQKQKKVERREGEVEAGFRHVDLPISGSNFRSFRSPAPRFSVSRIRPTSFDFARSRVYFPSADCFDNSIFRFVNAFASNYMQMHALSKTRRSLVRFCEAKLQIQSTLKL